jgi:protein ImuA
MLLIATKLQNYFIMGRLETKKDMIMQLQREILSMEGGRATAAATPPDTGLGIIEQSFAGKKFPTGAIHEFISYRQEDATATNAFVAGLLGRLMQEEGTCLWVSTQRTIFPPALKLFGVHPDRIIFADVAREKDALWIIEEGLKCEALTTVVGEIQELDFTASRRLQLAVEQSKATGFIHRRNPKIENTVTCATRWKIKPIPGIPVDGMPGIGLPSWQVDLIKVRNGTPGTWQLEWMQEGFRLVGKYRNDVMQTLKAEFYG